MRPFRFPSLGNGSEQPSRHNHPSPRRDPDERLGQINILGPIYRRPPAPPSRDIQLAAARDSESSLHIHPPRLAQAGPRSPSRPSPTTLAAARGCGGGGGGGGLGVAAEAPLGGEQAPTEVLERLPDGVLRPRRVPPHSESAILAAARSHSAPSVSAILAAARPASVGIGIGRQKRARPAGPGWRRIAPLQDVGPACLERLRPHHHHHHHHHHHSKGGGGGGRGDTGDRDSEQELTG